MAKIYSRANCVIIWLGKEADGSDQALEAIRITAAGEPSTVLHSDTTLLPIFAVLLRPWFQRIWV